MTSGLAAVHWARIIVDEGHELGGNGLGDLIKVSHCCLVAETTPLTVPCIGARCCACCCGVADERHLRRRRNHR